MSEGDDSFPSDQVEDSSSFDAYDPSGDVDVSDHDDHHDVKDLSAADDTDEDEPPEDIDQYEQNLLSACDSDPADPDPELPAAVPDASVDECVRKFSVPLYGPGHDAAALTVIDLVQLLSALENNFNVSEAAMQTVHSILLQALPRQHNMPGYNTVKYFKERKSAVVKVARQICRAGCEAFKTQTECTRCHALVEDSLPFTTTPLQGQLQALLLRSDLTPHWMLPLTVSVGGNTGSLYDSPGWREQVIQDADFVSDPRNIVLGFSGDSADAYNDRSNPYPIYPEMLVVTTSLRCFCFVFAHCDHVPVQVYNFPKEIRYLPENMLIAGIIPPSVNAQGKHGKPANLDGFLEVLVDELVIGYDDGFAFSVSGQDFVRRVKLIHQMGDYPGQAELSKQTSHTGCQGMTSRSETDIDENLE
jgi:ribosomal protein L7/L12